MRKNLNLYRLRTGITLALVLLAFVPALRGEAVKLPGTMEQISYYVNYLSNEPSRDLIYHINEHLLFYRVPDYFKNNRKVWKSFKTPRRFRELQRRAQKYKKNMESQGLAYRLGKIVGDHRELLQFMSRRSSTSISFPAEVSFDLRDRGQYKETVEMLKLMGIRLARGKGRGGAVTYDIGRVYHKVIAYDSPYYELAGIGLPALKAYLDQHHGIKISLNQCEVQLPWGFSFLSGITGLSLSSENFVEVLTREKRLQLLLGILYRLSGAETAFIDGLEPLAGSRHGAWSKIYTNDTLLTGLFLLSHALRVEDGRLLLPGGDAAAGFWAQVAGAHPYRRPAEFLYRLANSHGGKLNYLYVFSFFLPEDIRSGVLFEYGAEKATTLYLGMPLEKSEQLDKLRLPELKDFNIFTLFYVLESRDGRVYFPGGIEPWARALGVPGKGPAGILEALTAPGKREQRKTFISVYSRFHHRPGLLTPEVLQALFNHYENYNVLVDYIEKIPIREPRTVLNMLRWVKGLEGAALGKKEKMRLTAAFQAVLEVLSHTGTRAPETFNYDYLVDRLLKVPLEGAAAYDGLFDYFEDRLDIPLASGGAAPRQGLMNFLFAPLHREPVTIRGQSFSIDASAEQKNHALRIIRSQEACSLSTLVTINRLLAQALEGGNAGWSEDMSRRLREAFEKLPHPDPAAASALDSSLAPLVTEEYYSRLRIPVPYSSGRMLRRFNLFLEKKTASAPVEELRPLVQEIKGGCLMAHLKHYLVSLTYALAVKNSKLRVFINPNLVRFHDFSPTLAWKTSGLLKQKDHVAGFRLQGGLSRLNILLAYPYSKHFLGRGVKEYTAQAVPAIFNNLDLYPDSRMDRVQEYTGLMVLYGKELLNRAREDSGLREGIRRRLALLTAGRHYRRVMAGLELSKTSVETCVRFAEYLALGEHYFWQPGHDYRFSMEDLAASFREDMARVAIEKEMNRLGSIYYHTFGTLRSQRFRMFPQPLSHFFATRWVGGEMINEFKIKAAYISYLKQMPPQLLGFFIYDYLRYARRYFAQDYENDFDKTFYMYSTYNYLYLENIFKKLKTKGIVRLK